MDLVPLAAVAFVFAVLTIFVVFIIRANRSSPSDGAEAERREEQVEVQAGVPPRRGAADRMRNRLRQRVAARAQAEAMADPEEPGSERSDQEGSDEEDSDDGRPDPGGKRAKKAARRAKQEAERAAREARAGKSSAYAERQKRKDAVREQREQAQEEEIQRLAKEAAAAEEAEAAKWMGMISVEEEGTGETGAQEEAQGMLSTFIAFIQQRKMVSFEELAIEFKLRSKDVVDRIQGLEAMGRLTGLMDERGKYIYLTIEEMEAVANFIRTKGRVAIAELAQRSNVLIDLEPKADVAAAGAGSCLEPQVDFDAMFEVDEALTVA